MIRDEAIRFGDAVAQYLKPLRDELKDYQWVMGQRVPEAAQKLGLSEINATGGLDATHALRADVARKTRKLQHLPKNEREASLKRTLLLRYQDMGALRSNKDETIATYAASFTSD